MVLAENVERIGIVVGEVMGIGFKMAGVEHVYSDPSMVKVLLDEKDIGLIVITSKIFEMLDEQTKNRVVDSVKPSVVVLDANEEKMKEYVKKVTGAEV
jgi:vacuolar-type H+-ATPase subunit F/Vma7